MPDERIPRNPSEDEPAIVQAERKAEKPAPAAPSVPAQQPAMPAKTVVTEPRSKPRIPSHDPQRIHGITTADGPGSPGGLARPGRASAVEGMDQGYVGHEGDPEAEA